MNKKNKTAVITIALISLLAISVILFIFPTILAQEPFRKTTYPVVELSPNVIGVGQPVLVALGLTVPVASAEFAWENFTLTITKPDGEIETFSGINSNPDGLVGFVYTPYQVGNYTFVCYYPGQVVPVENEEFGFPPGTIMEPGTSPPRTLVVQAEPLPEYPRTPLPDEYWSRPIDGQHRGWYEIAGNWLIGTGYVDEKLIPGNLFAPETPHILWAKALVYTAGGALGGGLAGPPTGEHSFDSGDAYEGYFGNKDDGTVIIAGVLYFNRYKGDGGDRVEHEAVAVNLRTGEEIWAKPLIGPDGENHRLNFGQIFYWDGYNMHADFTYLWSVEGSTWHAFEPSNGRWIYSMENVPVRDINPQRGAYFGSKGEIIGITVNLRRGWMAKWNSELVVLNKRWEDLEGQLGTAGGSWLREYTGTVLDASYGYEWNVTIPAGLPGRVNYVLEDRVIGGDRSKSGVQLDDVAIWAISTAPETEGDLIFNITWPLPSPDVRTNEAGDANVEEGVIITHVLEEGRHYAHDIDTGEFLWRTEPELQPNWYVTREAYAIAYGRYYTGGINGMVYCYNVTTGELLWKYENVDPYALSERWTRTLGMSRPSTTIQFIADGKLYIRDTEHSPDDPLPRGEGLFVLDAFTGEEIWKPAGLFKGTRWGGQAAIGDNIIALIDTYDARIYAIGKGPSETTVSIQNNVISLGNRVMITGTVMDISAGTTQQEIAVRFPNGVPAISDENMGAWMRYVYKQFQRPEDVTGVKVKLTSVDPNGNYQDIGEVTTDMWGNFGKSWVPPVPGDYFVLAEFEGTESYWRSSDSTYFSVDAASSAGGPIEPEPSPSPSPSASPSPSPSPSPAAPLAIPTEIIVAAVVAVAVVAGIGAYWVIRKRR